MTSVIKGGKKRGLTNLQIRRKLWDALPDKDKDATTRPGSNSSRKQA